MVFKRSAKASRLQPRCLKQSDSATSVYATGILVQYCHDLISAYNEVIEL